MGADAEQSNYPIHTNEYDNDTYNTFLQVNLKKRKREGIKKKVERKRESFCDLDCIMSVDC